MGAYMTCYAEKKDVNGKYVEACEVEKLSYQSYNLFGFLCNIRNYAEIPGISCKTRGFPKDASEELITATEYEQEYSRSWATVEELNNFNYNILYVNKRNDNTVETIGESLGEAYFEELKYLNDEGFDRIVFFID